MKYEIATLKASMRNIMDSRNSTIPVLVDKHFKRHSKLDIDNLINSSNMEEFVNNLSGSVYEKTIRKVYELDIPTLFDYEMSLDLFFFNYVWDNKNKFIIAGDECYLRECLQKQIPTGCSYCPQKSKAFIEKYSKQEYTVFLSHDK